MKSKWWLIGLTVSLLLAGLSPLASSYPDGLERVAEDKGFISLAGEAPFHLIANYVFPGIANEVLAGVLAGLIGTLVLFSAVYGLAWLLVLRKKKTV